MKMLVVLSCCCVVLLSQSVGFAQTGNTVWKKTVTRQVEFGNSRNNELKQPAKKKQEITLLETLVKEVRAGRLAAYSNFDRSVIARNDNNYTINSQIDTITVIDPVANTERGIVRVKELDFNIHTYRIQEEWSYEPATGATHVQITDIAPVREIYGDDGELRGIQAMFWVKYKDAVAAIQKYETTHPGNKLTEAIWSNNFKTGATANFNCNAERFLDLTQQPEDTLKRRLTDITNDTLLSQRLVYAVRQGRFAAYDTSSTDLSTKYPAQYISAMTDPRIDSVMVINPLDGTESKRERVWELDYHTVEKYKLLEHWKFDPNSGKTDIRITGIAPIRNIYNDEGIYKLSAPMFWLRFPDVAGVIAQYEQYHPENTVAAHVWVNYFYSDVKPGVVK